MIAIEERPKTFSELLGQKHILTEMKNRSKDLSFPKYMLFHGRSGTGKTSYAFIVAKLLTCINPKKNADGYFDPCNECDSCKRVNNGNFRGEISYMNAADISKKIIENYFINDYHWFPVYNKERQVYIIDEAHLFASDAIKEKMQSVFEKKQNRKPMKYFIFCTTTVNKFSSTFLSRLVKYNFSQLEDRIISERLIKYINGNIIPSDYKQEFSSRVIPAIARHANGNMREAYTLLDRCLSAKIYNIKDAEEAFDLTQRDMTCG